MSIADRATRRIRTTTTRALAAAALVAALSAFAHAQAARSVADGVYSDAQAARGATVYAAQCASCHGAALDGAQAPPLAGDGFLAQWQGKPLSELADKIRNTMPADAAGTLTRAQSVDLVAHMLQAGRFRAGTGDLAADEASLARITLPARAVPEAAAGPGRVYPPIGNMAQLMRGIFFPNSNLIFTVQTVDPGAPPPPAAAGAPPGGFSWVDWGSGIYRGWELVDNAAIALADASPLMLAPGIRCENGRPAPVTDPDWIRFTEEMIAVARKTYQVSQTRNQEAVAEATGDLSDACAACHRAYRDIRRPGDTFDPADPSNKVQRCLPR